MTDKKRGDQSNLLIWVKSPEGQAELRQALLDADAAVEQLEAERSVTWKQLNDPMTI